MTAGLACRNVTVTYRDGGGTERRVLHEGRLTAAPGELVTVAGATGAGKTTLLAVLGGLRRPDAGEVLADGVPVSRWSAAHLDRWRRQVGFVFQEPQFLDDLSVLENVLLPLVPLGTGRAEGRRRAAAVLDRFAVGHLADRKLWQLSTGEAQRVGLARALVGDPRFVLADEPTAHQDDAAVHIVADVLSAAAAEGRVVVVASHDPRWIGSGAAGERFILQAGHLLRRP